MSTVQLNFVTRR